MCGSQPCIQSSRTKVIETNTATVKLKSVSNESPRYTFNLHLNSNPNVTYGYRVPGTTNQYVVDLCATRWNEIRAKALNSQVETAWDHLMYITTMRFSG